MTKRALTLDHVIKRLRAHYGPPERPPTSDPFELILLENVAYLANPARRREAFEKLRKAIGTSPPDLLAADPGALERVTAHGILASKFAAKLQECARIALDEFGGDLGPATRRPLAGAKRALRLFPGIGEPGAEKILLFSGRQALLAPESNGLRVLVRLGLVRDGKSYARTYAGARILAKDLPARASVVQEAHLLLQQHGQTLCKRGVPRCAACPLEPDCAHARRERRGA